MIGDRIKSWQRKKGDAPDYRDAQPCVSTVRCLNFIRHLKLKLPIQSYPYTPAHAIDPRSMRAISLIEQVVESSL